ncbi:zinc finger BED domain-containing protein RICESLEEPER 2-like [Juglans microcarpa x Juglans regia]|uniref:zinc finger BED domain-containing protein RICESLEEPER 2-like n=1 Tax=Juglans microcarpa x Juglans regia TaxID=2249226 RepID=UPI001B7E6633|nr:zinc finger BED domain-containing protein RICESLEEPER 2-like [Juglans microcarpa x Juglans regia]
MCLHDWRRPKVLAITLDNASSNNGTVSYLKKKTKYRKDTVLEHELLHVRCCANILNLIVREGLREFDESIVNVRCVVKYVKSSPQRWNTFMKCIWLEEIASKSDIYLDVPTRWNSTYLMLEWALKFRKTFERLEEEDSGFLRGVGDYDDDDDQIGDVVNRRTSKKLGPPNNNDWKKYKMRYFDFALECMYANDPTKAVDLSWKVKNALIRMYEAYADNERGNNSDLQQQRTSPPREEVNSTDGSGSGRVDRTAERMTIFKQRLQSENTLESKNEVDRYLAESCDEAFLSFDILIWWRVNSVRYRVLSKVARDVFTIPISTIASESTFNMAGRVLDPFRNSLSPMMVEALICT